jgi:hypothetical protein
LNWDIVDAMSTVKELMLSPAGIVPELAAGLVAVAAAVADEVGAVEVVDEDDEQPATTMAATAATATQANLGSGLNVPWPCEREGHPP